MTMGCITLIAPTITMATTQFMPEVRREPCCWLASGRDLHAPRMNWVVVTDENQNRRMQMLWVPSAD
jgi:hypothetical protein